MRTPITYYGGKQLMSRYIVPIIDAEKYDVYNEPFFGGGAIFWAKKPAKIETINDTNGNVVNFYEVMKLRGKELLPLIDATLISRDQHRRATAIYKNPGAHDAVQKAWAFWFCTNFSFAGKPTGGLRYSNHQYFSVPSMLRLKKNEFNEALIKRIENTTIENKDALEIIESRNVKETLHYLDPPYPECDQGHYRGYTMLQFIQLLDMCVKIKGKFILSSYHYPILRAYCDLYHWHQMEFDKPVMAKNVFLKGKGKKVNEAKKEVLTMNFVPKVQQQKLALVENYEDELFG